MNEKGIIEIFKSYPDAKELYQDAQGIVWISKKTAEGQSAGEKITILKRSDYITIKKVIKNGTESND